MMPVVKGAASTRRQILTYSVIVALVALAPAFTGVGGPLYLAVATLGGLTFVGLATRLALSKAGDLPPRHDGLYDVKASARPARNLFAFSIVYLFGLFAALLSERVLALWGVSL